MRRLECGIAWVNCSQPCFCQLPWGGVKQSGIGRDLGEEGFRDFLQPKQVVTYHKEEPLGWYLKGETLELAETLRARGGRGTAFAADTSAAPAEHRSSTSAHHLGCCGQADECCECTSRCVCRLHGPSTSSGIPARL
jgi:hypothetical protein